MPYSLDEILNDTSGDAAPTPGVSAPPTAPSYDLNATLNDTSGAKGAAEYPAGESPWSDDASVIAGAGHGVMAQHYSLLSALHSDNPDLAKGYEIAAQQSRKAQQDAHDSMSIAGQQALDAPGMTGGGMRGIRYGLEQNVVGTAPWLAAGAIGGLAGPGGAVAATTAYGAYSFAADASDQVDRTIQDADDTKLREINPDYDGARHVMPEDDAKLWLGQKIKSDEGLLGKSALVGGSLGAVGGAELSGLVGSAERLGVGPAESAALKGIVLSSVVKGATRGAGEMGVTGGIQSGLTQEAQSKTGMVEAPTLQSMVGAGLEQAKVGALFAGAGGWWHGRGDRSQRPAEDTHPANEPAKQPNLEGSDRDGVQTGGEAHIERKSQQRRAQEANKRDTGASPEAEKGTGPAPPSSPVGSSEEAALKPKPTPRVGEQPEVAQTASVQPTGESAAGPQGGPPAGEAPAGPPPPPPPPSSQPAAQPAPPAPVDPAVLAQQHAELLDASHPRDAMIYPRGAEVPDITKFPESWRYGKVPMPKADGRTVVYDHSPRGSGWRREAIKAAAKDGTLESKIEARAAEPPKPEFVAEAQPAAAAEGVKEAPAAAAEAAPGRVDLDAIKAQIAARRAEMDAAERGEQPQAVQEPSVEPRVAEEAPTPESKAPTEEKLGENKFGVSIWRKADGSYLKRYADGRPDVPTTEETAQLLLKAESYKSVKSESETIREAAQTEAEKLKLAREKVATLSTKDEETGEETAKPLPEAGARVLHAEDDLERERQEAQAKADIERGTAKPAVPPKRVAQPKELQKAGKKSPEDVARMKEQNATANDVVDRHQPKDEDARNREANAVQPGRGAGAAARAVVLMRAKAMLEDAAKNKYEFKGRAMHRIDPDVRHSNKALILYEAKLLVGKAGKVKIEDYARFLRNEDNLLHNGERAYTDVLGERSETGKERAAEIGAAVTERATGTGEEEAKATESADEAHERELGKALEAKRTKGEELKEKERQEKVEREKEAERQEGLRLEAERVKRSLPAEGEIISPARAKAMDVERGVEEEPTPESKKTPMELAREKADKEARERVRREEEAQERPANTLAEGEGYTPVKARTTGFQVEKRPISARPKNKFIEDARTPEELEAVRQANREFFKKNLGMTDEELDEMEAKQKETLAKLAKEGEPTPEEEKTLQVPNTRKDTKEVSLPTKSGWIKLAVRRNSNVRDMLTSIASEVRASGFATGDLAHDILQKVINLVGDVPVRYVSKKEIYYFATMDGMDARKAKPGGLYEFTTHQIIMNDQNLTHAFTVHAQFHEAIHAATSVALERFPEFKAKIREIMDAAYWHTGVPGEHYAFTDEHEFIAEIFSNQQLREYLAGHNIPNELKKQIDYAAWRKLTGFKRAIKTMWDLTALAIGKVLKLPPRGVSYLEAVLAVTEPYMVRHAEDVATGMPIRFIEGEGKSKGTRYIQSPPERDQEAAVRSHKETWARVKDIDSQVMKAYGKDTIHNLGGHIMKGTAKLLSGTWLNDVHGHLFTDVKGKILEAINDAQNRVSHLYSTLMSKDKDLINRGYMLDRTHASQMAGYARLVDMSVRYNIHADRVGAQPPKNLWDAARNAWQQIKYGDEARAIYNHLDPELQKRYRDEKKYYVDKQGDAGKIMVERLLPMFDAPKGRTSEEVLDLARKNELEDSDWTHYQKLGVADVLHEAYRLQAKKDVYFNSQRGDGRFVVGGREAMPKGGKDVGYDGSELRDDTREFDSEQQAHAFATSTRMKATTREINYHKDNASGEIVRVSGEEASSVGDITPKYQVRLERQHYHVADSRAEARRIRQAMEADGIGELTGVMDRRDERAWSELNTADQKLLEKKIDGNTNWSDFEKQQMKDISRQMMLGSRGGMGAHMIQARKVAGARFDSAAGLHAYAKAANFHIARNTHAPALDDAMDRLNTHEKAMQTKEPDEALRRSIVKHEYRDRVYGRNASPLGSKSSPFMHRMMTWAFVNFLARPSHILLSQLHPYIYSVPMLAARHGYWKSLQGQRQAMKDLGGMGNNLWEGAKAGYQVYKSGSEQNIDKAVAMARGVDPILRMINGLKDKGERDALMKMWETEHLHSAFDASVFEGSGQDRMNAVIRQFTDAMEANNRLSTALNAYRLEKSMHKDPGNALAYSRRVIEQTHGVFSPTNAASVFKNPIVRPIMQFRQQPMNLAIMMYRNMGKALPEKLGGSGDNEARWTLAYQLGTAAALGGMGGMPMDLPKLVGLGTQAMGGPAPSDWDDKFYRTLESNLGPTAAKLIHDGIPGMMGPYGPSLGHRTGYDAGFIFGEPKSNSASDELSFIAKQLAGASVGMGMDWLDALHYAEQGEWGRAGENLMPGSLRDFAKAYRNATEGQMAGKEQVSPPSFGKELLQSLGFSDVKTERLLTGHYALQKAVKTQETVQDQLKAKHASREKSVLGVKVPKKEHALGDEYESAYQ